jgi:hypothetical protein
MQSTVKIQNEPNFTTCEVFYCVAISLIAAGDSTLLPFPFYLLPFFQKRTQFYTPDSFIKILRYFR